MFTTVEIAEVTGGKLLGGSVTVTGVSTDTRTIAPGMLFVAIRGESFDGNDYIGAAAEKGAGLRRYPTGAPARTGIPFR